MWLKGLIGTALAMCLAWPEEAQAQRNRNATWTVSESSDPITGTRRCVVAAFDRVAGHRYSRTGYLYPFVESNSETGVLIGVSSGGQVRLPTGDILWRVDEFPHRELNAADNPFTGPTATGDAMQDLTAYQLRIIQAATATATVASGDRAQEMLREMLAGQNLIFRSARAAPSYGLPSDATNRVGQVTRDGLRPIPIDQSFRDGLAQCGISVAATETVAPTGEP